MEKMPLFWAGSQDRMQPENLDNEYSIILALVGTKPSTHMCSVHLWLHPVPWVLPATAPCGSFPLQVCNALQMLGALLLPELVQFLSDDNILTCAAQLFPASGTTFPVFILGILPPTRRPAMVGILWTRSCAPK